MTNATFGEVTLARPKEPVQPAYVRVTHWINAIAMMAMIGSGWEIYNASPLFPFVFPKSITLRGSRWRTRVEQALTVRFYEPGRNIEEVRKSRVRRFSPASLRSH